MEAPVKAEGWSGEEGGSAAALVAERGAAERCEGGGSKGSREGGGEELDVEGVGGEVHRTGEAGSKVAERAKLRLIGVAQLEHWPWGTEGTAGGKQGSRETEFKRRQGKCVPSQAAHGLSCISMLTPS